MTEFPDARIIVFAKAPLPGEVKTRLIPNLGAHGAARLHEALARRTLATAAQAELSPVHLWCAPSAQHPFFADCRARFSVTLHTQQGADLGARMAHALEKTLHECAYAVIIGADCPTLTRDDLREALQALRDGCDAVLGPAEDGGYVLLGVRRADAALFDNIDWGGAEVLDATRARLTALGWRRHELAPRWDVDRPEDIERMRRARLLPEW